MSDYVGPCGKSHKKYRDWKAPDPGRVTCNLPGAYAMGVGTELNFQGVSDGTDHE